MSHTPGPWFLNSYMRHQILAPGEREAYCVAYTCPSSANSGANARLIAAAPDLLAACELFMEEYDFHYCLKHCQEWEKAMYATIANAVAKAAPTSPPASEQ